MFREMRRKKQQLSEQECRTVLERATSGVLSVMGDDGYPYGVPVSYVYREGKMYFHCAKSGHKLDAISRNPKVCFTVVDQDLVVPEELTSYFRSVICFGIARILKEPEEKMNALLLLSNKYSGSYPEKIQAEAKSSIDHLEMVEIQIEHMTGKAAKELTNG